VTSSETWIFDDATLIPTHQRTIEMVAFDTELTFQLRGRLRDERPWADGDVSVRTLHGMELRLEVRRSDLVIVRAEAQMGAYPHAECPNITPAFQQLVGLNVGRGFTKAVQALLGRERGCSHLEFLSRALAPVVIQTIPSTAMRREPPATAGSTVLQGTNWLANTCHMWSEDGPGSKKIALGWRPGGRYPAPSVEEVRAQKASD